MEPNLLDHIGSRKPSFSPRPRYRPADDTLIYRFDSRESYAKRIDAMLTLFLSDAGGEITGVEIKGVKELLRRLKSFSVEVEHHEKKVRLKVILLAYYSTCPPEPFRSHQDEVEKRLKNQAVALV